MTTATLLRFVVRRITFAHTLTGFLVTCYTNNPCHLWFRSTTTVPQKHINSVIVRGGQVGTYIDQCFVAFTDLEQNEPGDTHTHTFTVEPWPVCETRWFYFWGTVDGNLSPSASCIFAKHRTAPPGPFIFCQTDPWLDYGTVDTVRCYRFSSPFKPGLSFDLTHLTIEVKASGTIPVLLFNTVQIFTANPDGSPNTAVSPPATVPVPSDLPPIWTPFKVPFPDSAITANTLYTIIYGSDAPYESPAHRIAWRAGIDPTCPHLIPEDDRLWTQNCTNANLPCDCSGKPWYSFILRDLRFIIEGNLP